ncbi:MAG: hypothetical protein U0746_06435 [Gemmataceae bacterium]
MGTGTAQLTLTFDAWKDGNIAATEYEAEVARPATDIKVEPVSPRLRARLAHPTRRGSFAEVAYSPDGKRLIAVSNPENVIQVWDAVTGRELTTIEVLGPNLGPAQVTADGTTAYAAIADRRAERVERDGRPFGRYINSGEVRSWDLTTGRPGRVFRPDPPAAPWSTSVSPDGRWLMTTEEPSAEGDDRRPLHASLWEVATGRRRQLPQDLDPIGAFTADSTMFAAARFDGKAGHREIDVFDTATGTRRHTISSGLLFGSARVFAFSPDGRRLCGLVVDHGDKNDRATFHSRVVAWDVAAGREAARFPAEGPNTPIEILARSPDGSLVVAVTFRSPRLGGAAMSKLYLLDAATLVPRATAAFDANLLLYPVAFRPDGKRLAVVADRQADDAKQRSRSPDDYPQPRVLLIDPATAAVRATLVLPPCFCHAIAFSPDGKTLAAGGYGQVLLLDVDDL